jgi:hypothetical protein
MSDGKLAEANASLADPLPFESAGADQLGLVVVGQLAKRHDIQVTLRRNPYGGTTAIVLLPHALVMAEGFGELSPAKALEVAQPILGRQLAGEQSGFADEADTEPDLPGGGEPGTADVAGAPALAYQAAPPAAATPPAAAPPRVEAGPPPSAEAGAPDKAEAESQGWTGMESPAWNGPPRPATPPARNGTNPPVLPRRVRRASPVTGLEDGPPNHSSLPGRFPSPRSPGDARTTSSAIQHGVWRGWPIPGRGDGLPHVPGVAEDDGAASHGAAEDGGGGSSGTD